ncbi:hypothetical protein LCGC14_2637340 [marine sediment metagenome]|uniref:Uncharacterized protein n=1 Tax=marine sediment metagenome TaxID=412755 RepID=A0A0F9C9E4_9ZZZZ
MPRNTSKFGSSLPSRKKEREFKNNPVRKTIFCPECDSLLDTNRYCYACQSIIQEKGIQNAKTNKNRPLKELKTFLNGVIKFSHIYQPFIIQSLLLNNGVSSIYKIAEEIAFNLNGDIDYYKKRIQGTPMDVLIHHNIIHLENDGKMKLRFELYNQNLVREIIELCDDRIETYLKNKTSQESNNKKIKKIAKNQLSNDPYKDYNQFITIGENGLFRYSCGKTYLSAQKTHILNHLKICTTSNIKENIKEKEKTNKQTFNQIPNRDLSLRKEIFSFLNNNPTALLSHVIDEFKAENKDSIRTYYNKYYLAFRKNSPSISKDNIQTKEFIDFLMHKMRGNSFYQPFIIISLLKNKGTLSQ